MMTQSFYKHALLPLIPNKIKPNDINPYLNYRSANGYGLNSERIRYALKDSIIDIETEFLTFQPWAQIFDSVGNGLLKKNFEWCHKCFKDDIINYRTPYVRLAWLLKPYTICPHHNIFLQKICLFCNNSQSILPKIPRIWICQHCGNNLIDKIKYKKNKPTSKDTWMANAIENFIESTCAQSITLKSDSLKNSLQSIVKLHTFNSYEILSSHINIGKKYLFKWANGIVKPTFIFFLELCYRLDIPPNIFLFENLPLTNTGMWRTESTIKFVSKTELPTEKLYYIKIYLHSIIKGKFYKNISPSTISKKFNITHNVLRYHFPDEYSVIKRYYQKRINEARSKRNKERLTSLISGVKTLTEKGIYPSERKLKEFKLVQPSILRQAKFKIILKKLQKKYSKFTIKIKTN